MVKSLNISSAVYQNCLKEVLTNEWHQECYQQLTMVKRIYCWNRRNEHELVHKKKKWRVLHQVRKSVKWKKIRCSSRMGQNVKDKKERQVGGTDFVKKI